MSVTQNYKTVTILRDLPAYQVENIWVTIVIVLCLVGLVVLYRGRGK